MVEERIVKKKKSRFFWGFVLGLILGLLLAQFVPVWWERYLPESLRSGRLVEGEVLGKEERPDRLLLKISTADGVLLATFTDKLEEINLLVETGDNVTLRVQGYQPFLNDPPIERVQQSGKTAEAELPNPQESAEFQRKMERNLDELEPKIAELEKAAQGVPSDIKPEVSELLEDVRAKRDAAREKLSGLEQSSGAAWQELRPGIERAWQELQEAFDRAASRLQTESPRS